MHEKIKADNRDNDIYTAQHAFDQEFWINCRTVQTTQSSGAAIMIHARSYMNVHVRTICTTVGCPHFRCPTIDQDLMCGTSNNNKRI